MGLKILCSGDWHLDSPLPGRQELRSAQLEIPRKIADLCHREQADLVLLAGDLFDGPYSRESLEAVRRALFSMRVPVLIAPGNHDFCNGSGVYEKERFSDNVTIFHKAKMESVSFPELGVCVYGAGFESMDCPALLSGFAAESELPYKIGIVHGDPMNSGSPSNPISRSQVEKSGLQLLCVGHIHKAGMVQAGKTLCLIPGSPMGRDFGESGEKGAWIVTVDEKAEARFCPLDLPCFYEVTCDGEHIEAPADPGKNYYRITVTGYSTEETYPDLPHVTWVDETIGKLDIWKDLEEDSFTGMYFRRLQEKWQAGDADALAAAELSRRLLDGQEVPLC